MEDFIRKDDNIYDIVKKYPQLKDVLIKLSPNLKKIYNPVLFNTVAKRTTVGKAAEMGKVYINEMLLQLNEAIGKGIEYFEWKKKQVYEIKDSYLKEKVKAQTNDSQEEPAWMGSAEAFPTLDVREDKEDPFLKITKQAADITAGNGFILVHKFEPLPIISYLSSKGFAFYKTQISENEYHIYFYKPKE